MLRQAMGLALAAAVLTPGLPAAATEATGATILFDVSRTAQRVAGFGANIWPGDLTVEGMFRSLRLNHARLWLGLPPDPAPRAAATRDEFDRWWATYPGAEPLRATAALARRLRLRVILCIGNPPVAWLGEGRRLKPEYHTAFARLWGAAVHHCASLGLRPPYLELYNEPDGDWNIHVPPAENGELVKRVRAELDDRGYRDVGIVGPGTAHIDWGPEGERWVNALDEEAVRALAAWSIHAWEWGLPAINAEGGQTYVRQVWPHFEASLRRKDPRRRLPLLITEYATKATCFHGVEYPSPDGGRKELAASDTVPYAVRVYENTLSLLNGGANAAILWEAADQEWSNHEWGLLRRPSQGSTPRPVLHALQTLLPWIPAGARVVPALRQCDAPYAAAFVKDQRLVVALANGTHREVTAVVGLRHARRPRLQRALPFPRPAAGTHLAWHQPLAGTTRVTLPPDSTLTLLYHLQEGN